jgi:Tfp pilus assembly protein PilO
VNSKAKIWLAGGLAAALAVVALGYVLLVKPKGDDVTAKKVQVVSLQAQNATLQSQIDQLLAQSKQITAKQVELARVANRIPADVALPSLIRRLVLDAHNSDVDLVSFVPGVPVASKPYVTGAAPYQEVPLTMEVHGTYAALHEWFTSLEEAKRRLIVVEKVAFTEPKATDTTGAITLGPDGIPETNRTITATISARTFDTSATTITADLPALGAAATTAAGAGAPVTPATNGAAAPTAAGASPAAATPSP